MDSQTCGNCKYSARWTMTNHTGTCTYKLPEPIWPLGIRPYQRSLPKAGGVTADETGCPCWAGKEAANGPQ